MAKEYARSFYNSVKWKRTQAAYIASKHYVCERCGRAACLVHHKVYITPRNIHDIAVTLKWENLEALCIDCHNAEHMSKGSCAKGLRFDNRGNIVKIQTESPPHSETGG